LSVRFQELVIYMYTWFGHWSCEYDSHKNIIKKSITTKIKNYSIFGRLKNNTIIIHFKTGKGLNTEHDARSRPTKTIEIRVSKLNTLYCVPRYFVLCTPNGAWKTLVISVQIHSRTTANDCTPRMRVQWRACPTEGFFFFLKTHNVFF